MNKKKKNEKKGGIEKKRATTNDNLNTRTAGRSNWANKDNHRVIAKQLRDNNPPCLNIISIFIH